MSADTLQPGDDVLIVAKVRRVLEDGSGYLVGVDEQNVVATRGGLRTTADLERIADELVDKALRKRQAAAATAAIRAVLDADRRTPARRGWWRW